MRILPYVLALLCAVRSAAAISLPVTEDSFSDGGKLSSAAGKAGSLSVSTRAIAFLRFHLPPGVAGRDIESARLRLFVTRLATPSSLQIRSVASNWSEDVMGPSPTISDSAAVEPELLRVTRSKQFVFFDITSLVRAWLDTPDKEHGLAVISKDGKLVLGSKEGSGSGYPAEIELDLLPASPQFAMFWEEQPPQVNGGSGVADAWQKRTLNMEVNESDNAITRVGDTIVLQPGTYHVRGSSPASLSEHHQAAVRDVTETTHMVVIRGTSEYSGSFTTPSNATRSLVEGYIRVEGGPRRYELWHYIKNNRFSGLSTPEPWVLGVANQGRGVNNNTEPSVFSVLNISKVK